MAKKDNHDCECNHEHDCCEHEHQHDCCEHDHEHCDCGCDCEDEVVMLQDDEGNDIPFHYVYNIEHEGKEYVYLQRADSEDDCVEIFAVQTVQEKDEYYDLLDPVDDDLYDILYDKLLQAADEECADDGCDCHHDDCDCHHEENHHDDCDCHKQGK